MRSPFQAPDPRQMKRSPLPLMIGLGVLAVVVLCAVAGLVVGVGSASGISMPFGKKVAVLEVEGVIAEGAGYRADTSRLTPLVRRWKDDDSIQGMIIRINSPGGAVSATEDLHQAIREFAEEKPVMASFGDVAASGGYYLASASDRIYSNSGTLTGSIGVILSLWGYQDLVQKIGLEPRVVKSGKFKDIGSGARDLEQEELDLLQGLVASVHEQFFNVVLEGREEAVRAVLASQTGRAPNDIPIEDVKAYLEEICDGRIFSGQQALDAGLVDELGTFEDAVKAMQAELGLSSRPRIVRTPQPQRGMFGFIDRQLHQIESHIPGSVLVEFRFTM